MEDFLRECKNKLENLSNVEKVHVVLGSEACDLDSAVSTLVYSYFLYKICRDTNDIYLPVLNVSRKDFRLKTEVGYYFEENNINPSYILFKNEIDLKSLFKSGKLRLILLDHNTLPKDDVFMHPAIEEIIDHHKKCVDKYTLTDCSVVLEMVGSCASLVADKILVRDSNFFNYQLANLLYGAILLDTVGLDEKSGRVTEKDKQMLVKLEEYLPDVNRRVIFEKLQAAKMDITGLTVDESLRKDLKVVSISSVHIAISSLPVHIDKFVTKIATIDSLRRFNGDNNFQILIMMGIRVNKTTGEATRQLGVYSINIVCKQQVAEFLQVSCDLKLEPIELNIPTVSVFRQGNVSASRKVVLPLIQEYLAGYDTEKSARTRPSELTTNYRERNSSNNEEFNDFDPFESIDSLVFTPPNGITVSSSTNYLGVGDPLSLPLSSQNSSNQNSCPYTPQNSYADSDFGVEAFSKQLLPSFNSREMMEKIEIKRGKLRGYDGDTQENYPFTPKNSFVDSSFDSYAATVAIDSDTLRQKLNENQAHLDVDGIGFINGTDGAKPEENGDDKSPDDNSVVSSTGDKSEEKMDISTSGSDKGYASSPATAAVNHTYDDDDVNSKNNITKPTSDYTTNLGALKMDSETGIKYQTETVDFPESPHHMKLLANRTNSRLRSVSLDDEAALDASSASDEMVVRKERPTGFVKSKKKITVNPDILTENDDDGRSLSSLSNKSVDILSPGVDDVATPDDIETPDELDDSVLERMVSNSDPIPELSAAEEYDEERSWRTCFIAGVQRKIDMKVIEPYKKVLSHGGYCPDTRHAIIAFSACNLPDRSRKDYEYVMDNLFLYVLTTLDQLVAEDYILIYLQGATERSSMPSFGWLKRCYQMIDRRLRKNLKGLYLVHPSFWLKTIVLMTKPFISSKFSRKLRFVANLQELSELIPMDHVCIPDKVKQLEFELMIKRKKKSQKASNHSIFKF